MTSLFLLFPFKALSVHFVQSSMQTPTFQFFITPEANYTNLAGIFCLNSTASWNYNFIDPESPILIFLLEFVVHFPSAVCTIEYTPFHV